MVGEIDNLDFSEDDYEAPLDEYFQMMEYFRNYTPDMREPPTFIQHIVRDEEYNGTTYTFYYPDVEEPIIASFREHYHTFLNENPGMVFELLLDNAFPLS